MSDGSATRKLHREPTIFELFTPKLVTILREGYGPSKFRADTIAGLTVAIVALPLSMAIAIASGLSPDKGLFTAIAGGFLVSALGGSRFQIGGPAGASNGNRTSYESDQASHPGTVIYRLSGAFFFGAASTVGMALDRIAQEHKSFILDCAGVPFFDSTAANVLDGAARKAHRAGVRFFITGASAQARHMLFTHGVRPPQVEYAASIGGALEALKLQALTAPDLAS